MQTFEDRSHFANYSVVSTHIKQLGNSEANDGRKKPGLQENIKTDLVLTVGNYHFNRDASNKSADSLCRLQDLTVSLKFASTSFKPQPTGIAAPGEPDSAPAEPFFFDKGGVYFPFPLFASLANDKGFTEGFLPHLNNKLQSDRQQGGSLNFRVHDDNDDDEYAAAATLKRKEKTGRQNKKQKKARADDQDKEEDDEDAEEEEEEEDDDDDDDEDFGKRRKKNNKGKGRKNTGQR